ncbi:glycosyltransferase family 2 protein [Fibrella aestuarina]|uniref:glycosyltransferase family 2 protein n=1 Tax=Fibrella aestuarina TaxID=651143 RepID=UPI0009FC404F|nr:glycosyltransferase family 2 protein [Fibrella aestuarina]
MEKVSVCMATFNGAKFVKRQLLSILPQLEPLDEIIISDDNSTDDTVSVINSIHDKRIKVHLNKIGSGPTANFQNALYLCSGDIIVLCDQDDIWLPTKLSDIRHALSTSDLVITDCIVVDEKEQIIHESFFALRNSRKGFWRNLYKNSYVGCCMAFKKEVLSYSLPFPRHIHMHDWWIGLCVEKLGKVYFLDKPLIKYVRHGNNASPTGEAGYNLLTKLINRLQLLFYIIFR